MNNFFTNFGWFIQYPIIIILILIVLNLIRKHLITLVVGKWTSWLLYVVFACLLVGRWINWRSGVGPLDLLNRLNKPKAAVVSIPITPDSPYHLSPVYPGTDSTVNYGKFAAHIQWDNLVTEGYTVDTLHKNTTDTTYLVKTPIADPGDSWAIVGLQTNYKYYRSCSDELTEIATGNDPSVKLGVKSRFAAVELKHRWDQKTTIFLYQIPNSLTDSTSLYLNTKGFCI